MKLKSLHIEDYKVFKDFNIDFVDSEGKPLPIVVLAGVNGSGKTTLLEYIHKFDFYIQGNSYIELKNFKNSYRVNRQIIVDKKLFYNKEMEKSNNKLLEGINIHSYLLPSEFNGVSYLEEIQYINSGINNIQMIADEFVKSFYYFLKEKDYRPSEVKEHFHKYMTDIFEGIDLTFSYSHLDRDDNVWFINDNGEKFEIKNLSTGEKTLLSKIMYLYFLDYKDKVILIDEPELSLHPSWQNKVLKIYENFAKLNNCQIIIATHSPHIIGSAKNEYLRILRKNDEGKVEVIKDVLSYGRDIEWVLEEVMGTQYTREKNILHKIEVCQNLINDEKFDEAENAINHLEDVIGVNDSEILTLRNDLAFERIDFEEDN